MFFTPTLYNYLSCSNLGVLCCSLQDKFLPHVQELMSKLDSADRQMFLSRMNSLLDVMDIMADMQSGWYEQ